MARLERGFKADLREALLDEIEQTLRDEIGPELKQAAAANFQDYAQRNGYDTDHIWEDAEGPFVERQESAVSLRIEWPGLTALFEFGVSPHTIGGDPILSFVWEAPPEGTRPSGAPKYVSAQSVNWGSVTGGIGASHAIRDAVAELEQDLRT